MMQGDQFRLPIELKNNDGSYITDKEVKDIEVFVGTTRKTLSAKDIVYNEEENIYYIQLKQNETFLMRGCVLVQARILFLSGDVIGVNLGKIDFSEATSKVVLK